MSSDSTHPETSPWPHRCAVLLACATFPLIWIGGLVTTMDAGMAVPDWPTTFGYNLFLYPLDTWLFGATDVLVEHGHRLLASAVGLITIALVVVTMRLESRRWLKAMAWVALAGVIFQGVLGGMRVVMDARVLAMIHGCVGPAFFVFTGALASWTSEKWRTTDVTVAPGVDRLRRLALQTAILASVQLVLGALVRHIPPPMGPEGFRVAVFFHLGVAALLAGHIVALFVRIAKGYAAVGLLTRSSRWLVFLVVVQLALGVATWVSHYGWPAWLGDQAWVAGHVVRHASAGQVLSATAHVAIGSLILLHAWMLVLRSYRYVQPAASERRQASSAILPLVSLGACGAGVAR